MSWLIFPTQLFENIQQLKDKNVFIVEHPLYFSDERRVKNMNKLKLILHRASMKYYADYLLKNKINCQYVDFNDVDEFLNKHFEKNKKIYIYDPVDHLLIQDLTKLSQIKKTKLEIVDTPGFICSENDIDNFIKSQGSKKRTYFQTDFYRWQRKRLNILIDKNGNFKGGKLTYDSENRQPPPKTGFQPIEYHKTTSNKWIKEAQKYIQTIFPNNYGSTTEISHLAFTHKQAKEKLDDFIKHRLSLFGVYEDAVDSENPFLYHSLLSPIINVGLLTPKQVIQSALDEYDKNPSKIGLNNIEGFVRQIIGWREYYRMTYIHLYDEFVGVNLLGAQNRLSKGWYDGTLGIEPVDHAIKTAFKYGYIHHIQRLMIMGNFMVLCEISPNEMYRWFSEFAVDAYDWVMVPNVYGMVAYNDGGATTTKPYISSDNYVRKMSNYDDGPWADVWHGLYYRFIDKHYELLKENPRTRRMTWPYDKMSDEKLDKLINIADVFIEENIMS